MKSRRVPKPLPLTAYCLTKESNYMALLYPPPSQPMTPHSLTDKQRQRLEALQLYMNKPEPVLICRPCGYALKSFGERVSRHLAEKHDVPKTQRRGLSALVKSLQLGDPNDVAPRPDGLPPHEALTATRGHACRHCSYRTASDDLVCRHLSKAHGIKDWRKADGWQRDQIHSGVLLQSWSSALFALIHLTSGQAARGSELASIEHRNGTSTPRGVYVYSGALARPYHKAS
ncbi:hypothetical protein CH63R_14416 [Colletotrichum higginsianum IMI 349063]|uniref:C2H2-type domain-containing protein n=1 Tax=Colletotrichum higginsianum (strain IMI 349063) TaxID=759273 RepID=A0A1B7XQS5_COLHI|nr:hypothetical protein CH63R_14416 [Colletotrichum higginsianum IMI 349063]OBR02115.1 hypothetical protein CH63R_14416 [Colletotrichum higginsianum IMI 349063]